MRFLRAFAAVASITLGAVDATWSAPPNGWWWNPAESGRGYFIETRDGVTVVAAYLYESDGRGVWLVSGGPNTDPYNYTGQLFSKSKGQTLFGPYVAPSPANIAGTVTLHFSDDTRGTLTWPGGTVALERLIVGGPSGPGAPYSGWWWNPAEDGSGYSIEIQGYTLVFVGYAYAEDGSPAWYLSAGPMRSPAAFGGDLLRFSNGQTMGGPYRAPSAPEVVGTLDIDFTAVDEATFTFTERAPLAAAGVGPTAGRTRRTRGTPLVALRGPLPSSYTGHFYWRVETVVPGISTTVHTISATIEDMPPTAGHPALRPGAKIYAASTGAIVADVYHATTSPVCIGRGARVFTPGEVIFGKAVELHFDRTNTYFVSFTVHLPDILVTTTCTIPGGPNVVSTGLEATGFDHNFGPTPSNGRTCDPPNCTPNFAVPTYGSLHGLHDTGLVSGPLGTVGLRVTSRSKRVPE